MIDPTDYEKAAMAHVLTPLGEYVAEIGMRRAFQDLSRDEVLTLIEVVVSAYQEKLLEGSDEVPF
ncbi:MAG: DUF6511 domain-containing protein [Vampirovibrionales bacterium]